MVDKQQEEYLKRGAAILEEGKGLMYYASQTGEISPNVNTTEDKFLSYFERKSRQPYRVILGEGGIRLWNKIKDLCTT